MTPQRLGQHFLKDAAWRTRIVRHLPFSSAASPQIQDLLTSRPPYFPHAPDTWLEIGAGHGEMTRELAQRAARVIAIELDAKLLPRLEALAAELGNVTIVAGDVLALDLAQITGGMRFHVYGSLPYYITSPILHRLFEHAERIASINVIVQLEVAVRMTAKPGRRDYGYLSAVTQFYTQPAIALRLPPGAFQPRPKVASALVRMSLPGERAHLDIASTAAPMSATALPATVAGALAPTVAVALAATSDERAFLKFVGQCFEQKRKTIANNLRAHFPAPQVEAALTAAAIKRQARAEELSLRDFAALFRKLRLATDEHG